VSTIITSAYRNIIFVVLIHFASQPVPHAHATESKIDVSSEIASGSARKVLQGSNGLVLPPHVEKGGSGPFYCDNRIISVGLTMAEVETDCGEPAWKQRLHDNIVRNPLFYPEEIDTYVVDEWIYDFGPQRLLRFLRFRDGRLVGIRTGGYGYAGPAVAPTCGSGSGFRLGASKMEILFECGPPSPLETPDGTVSADEARRLAVESDEWTYDFGPNRFVYHLTFRRGRLIDVKTGDYGQR
jgi:hypothetical protein